MRQWLVRALFPMFFYKPILQSVFYSPHGERGRLIGASLRFWEAAKSMLHCVAQHAHRMIRFLNTVNSIEADLVRKSHVLQNFMPCGIIGLGLQYSLYRSLCFFQRFQ